jgi:hypothetical protein
VVASSQHTLRPRITLAGPFNTCLDVAHVVGLDDVPTDPGSDGWEECVIDARACERTQACDLKATMPGTWMSSAHHDDPAHMPTTNADSHDALMIGIVRVGPPSALGRALGGSVSTHLLRRAHRPVVVVPDATNLTKAAQ